MPSRSLNVDGVRVSWASSVSPAAAKTARAASREKAPALEAPLSRRDRMAITAPSPKLSLAIDTLQAAHLERRLRGFLRTSSAEVLASVELLLDRAESQTQKPLLFAISAHASKPALPLEELDRFVTRVNAMSSADAARLTSVIDRSWTRNDNARDPMNMADRRGVIYARDNRDGATDNDGLFQRFTASCGPSVIQMMLAEADPLYALKLHDAGLYREGTRDAVAAFQRELLEAHGGIAVGEHVAQTRARFRNALGRLDLGAEDKRALQTYVEGGKSKKLTLRAAAGLEKMRRMFDGFPTSRELGELRARAIAPRDEGLGFDDFAAALGKIITPATGVIYQQTTPAWGFARGQSWRHLDAVARTLRAGVLVPFGISEPSHWMLAGDVDGKKPNRRFLISDPLGGKTAWVGERELISGTFIGEEFRLCVGKERGYIDSFYLAAR